MALPIIEVAATILRNSDGQVLMAERRPNQIAGGYWELPGGKIEPGETPIETAARELTEEVGVRASRLRPGPVHEHIFPTKRIRLNLFHVDAWSGEPQGRERQRVAWADPGNPLGPVLPSNERILSALSLPPIYAVVNAGRRDQISQLLDASERAFHSGIRLAQLRAPELSPGQRVNLAGRLADIAEPAGARIMMVGRAIEARRAGMAGVHATASDLRQTHQRPQVPLWAATCHNDSDVERALTLGADFIVLAPIQASASHPDSRPLGWEHLGRLTATSPIPIYAQGGMTSESIGDAKSAGAVGVAVSLTALPHQGETA